MCANLMWTGFTLFNDHRFEDDGDLRGTITAQLADLESAPAEKRIRIAPPVRPAARSRR
ncbi:hypothetical protein ACGFZP_32830 [Kitasatospora sp. NPDC048239]|uniref:hypothetical protein n=1 Tax=Kitasatospora sp. NPDC048239 TaxID=3364046 RepID=UPI00371BF0C0